MKSHYLRSKLGRILLALSFIAGIGLASSTVVQAQWNRDRDRDSRRDQDRDRNDRRDRNRDYRRNDQYGRNGGYGNGNYGNGNYGNYGGYGNGGYGGYGNVNQVALNQGYQDGVYTGSSDAQRGQNYNPQRSHFYRNGHGDNGGYGGYGNSYQYQQAYRDGFLRGYQQGYQRYGGYNRRGNGNNGRWPFPW